MTQTVSAGDGAQRCRESGSSQRRICTAERSGVAGREGGDESSISLLGSDAVSGVRPQAVLKVYFSEVSFMTRKASRMGVDIRKLGN